MRLKSVNSPALRPSLLQSFSASALSHTRPWAPGTPHSEPLHDRTITGLFQCMYCWTDEGSGTSRELTSSASRPSSSLSSASLASSSDMSMGTRPSPCRAMRSPSGKPGACSGRSPRTGARPGRGRSMPLSSICTTRHCSTQIFWWTESTHPSVLATHLQAPQAQFTAKIGCSVGWFSSVMSAGGQSKERER